MKIINKLQYLLFIKEDLIEKASHNKENSIYLQMIHKFVFGMHAI